MNLVENVLIVVLLLREPDFPIHSAALLLMLELIIDLLEIADGFGE